MSPRVQVLKENQSKLIRLSFEPNQRIDPAPLFHEERPELVFTAILCVPPQNFVADNRDRGRLVINVGDRPCHTQDVSASMARYQSLAVGGKMGLLFFSITVPIRQTCVFVWEAPNRGKGFVPEGILVVEVEGIIQIRS